MTDLEESAELGIREQLRPKTKVQSGNRRVGCKPGKRGLWSGDAGLATSMHRYQELNILIHFYSHVSLSGLLLL